MKCSECSYANDQDFRFCQHRGYKRKVNTTESIRRIAGDLEKIDQRLQQLMNFDRATGYAKQKDSLKVRHLPRFTPWLYNPSDYGSARYLSVPVFTDKDGKTRFTVMTVDILGKRESMTVDV